MLTIVSQFVTGLGRTVQGLGYDAANDAISVYVRNSQWVSSYSTSGTPLRNYSPPGVLAASLDLDLASAPTRIAGHDVPAGAMLVFAGNPSPLISAFDPATGNTLAALGVQTVAGDIVGGTYDPARETAIVVAKDFGTDLSRLSEIDLATGLILRAFTVPGFSGGDVDLNPATGDLFFTSGFISGVGRTVIHMSTGGELLGQQVLPATGVLSGIDFDPDHPGDAWAVDLDGIVYQLSGFLGDAPIVGTAASEKLAGSAAGETIAGREGDDLLKAGGGDDFTYGGDGGDRLLGQGGVDYLDGGAGGDRLIGGGGRDVLLGGRGVDLLEGGAGADRFVFTAGDTGDTARTADLIADFSHSEHDRIDLSAIDAVPNAPWGDGFTFIKKAAFSGVAGELRYEVRSGETLVMGDTDGDGAADVFIRLTGEIELTAKDFISGTRLTDPGALPVDAPGFHGFHHAPHPLDHLPLA